MKNLARAELQPGMQVAEDIKNYRGDTIFVKGTTLDEAKIAKLARHSIMVVPILEKIDFAMTHFERVRLSDGFQAFSKMYDLGFTAYCRFVHGSYTDPATGNKFPLQDLRFPYQFSKSECIRSRLSQHPDN